MIPNDPPPVFCISKNRSDNRHLKGMINRKTITGDSAEYDLHLRYNANATFRGAVETKLSKKKQRKESKYLIFS